MIARSGRIAGTLFAAWLAACSAAPGPVVAPPPGAEGEDDAEPIEVEEASEPVVLDPLAVRLCDALHVLPAKRREACCGRPASSLALPCRDEVSAALGRGGVAVEVAAVERCAEATARELAGCDWVTPLLPELPAECDGLVVGKLAAGASCLSSLECATGLHCRGAFPPDTPGRCVPAARPGERCETPADNLAVFTRATADPRHPPCDGICVRGQCLAFVPAGGPCVASARCAPGLVCVDGRCAEGFLPGVGEACDGGCTGDAYCADGRCVARKPAGEPCVLPFECRALLCEKAPGAETGRCADPCGAPGT